MVIVSSFLAIDNPEDYFSREVPIGRTNDNVQLYLMNQNQQLLPAGLVGEICVAGDSVCRGYLNNEEETLKKFI